MKGPLPPILCFSLLYVATLLSGSYPGHLYAQCLPCSDWSTTNSVTYPALPPGKYTLHVQCKAANGRPDPELAYSFEIITPFQKTDWFFYGILGCCLLTGALIQYIISSRNLQQIREANKLYEEEQSRGRILAAKDFQEETGDKLTKINMLTRQLKSKIIITPDNTRILNQIEEHITGLYNSTSELLWQLDPLNENLYFILHHLHDVANDLVKDTAASFTFTGDEDKWGLYRLPADRSRDLILIFKEAIDNAIKYAEAKNISLSVKWKTKGILQMILRDNGVGFDLQAVKKGHGINDMHMRSDRLQGKLYVDSRKDKGTIINLTFKVPQNKQP